MSQEKSKAVVLAATMAMTCTAQTASAQETINATVLSGYTDRTAWVHHLKDCLLYTSPSPRDGLLSRMPSSA